MARRLDRFKKLERARPDAPGGDRTPDPGASLRFGKIEARKDAAEQPATDPFAPPPDDPEVPLEIAADDAAERDRLRAEREAKAQARLDAEAQRLAELRMQEEARQDTSVVEALARRGNAALSLSVGQRAYVALGALAVIAVLAFAIGRFMWGFAPVVVLIFLASLFQERRGR
ncbi:MAG: hypothetical protein JNL83_03645 [Myxococcales bacterium]|nr:hypothetical protein [Myxococcales bacterium]